ncbi:hypothetical protein [Thermococcus peptonophilus]|uniref:Uncharacterized protein n=1 Tax=Thermococcus peptonophilus TaxID=53952 RepID=A0A142CXH8_9EURY|nr:hypothetical protein [Thermococcus peptonophilus]AMQ19480.1 hypothetical protein A0127_00110 [Thermococcus peptonophilus]
MVMTTACIEILPDKKVITVRGEDGRALAQLTIDDLAEVVEFRYATPWNVTKDSLDKVALVLEDLAYITQSYDKLPEKKILIDMLKKRKY